MVVFPPAKINIGLQITEKRNDGYHNLVSVFYPIALCDVLEILLDENASAGSVKFHPSGLAVDGNPDNNLVLKAIRLFHSRHPLPGLNVYLHKVIPMGAGLGGGSSDATHTLLALNEMMGQPFKYYPLLQMALQLGSDCPFFITEGAQLAKGRGELLSPLPIDLKGHWLKIINPGIHIGTRLYEEYKDNDFNEIDNDGEMLDIENDADIPRVKIPVSEIHKEEIKEIIPDLRLLEKLAPLLKTKENTDGQGILFQFLDENTTDKQAIQKP
jgi:4-diphosphocytidyl-2C-methyl-D-erythritol kinase